MARTSSATQRISRSRFVISKICSILMTYIFMCLYHELFYRYLDLDVPDCAPAKRILFRRLRSGSEPISIREIRIRLLWPVATLILTEACTIRAIHEVFAVISVGLQVDEPWDWPALYGSLSQCTSLRNYWAKYHHLLFYRSALTYAEWISTHVLRLDPESRTATTRFVKNFLVFLLSGIMHIFVQPSRLGRKEKLIWWDIFGYLRSSSGRYQSFGTLTVIDQKICELVWEQFKMVESALHL